MPTTVRNIEQRYEDGDPITMLTAYDAPTARYVDDSGVDLVLVGDSAGHNHLGHDSTIPVTLEEALSNTAAVVRGTDEALVVGDMPFGTYGESVEHSVSSAMQFAKDAGADAVKMETAPEGGITVDVTERLTTLGVPVQGHLGLTPQRTNEMGGPVIQGREGRDSEAADRFVETARALESAGVFSLVLEGMTEGVAMRVTEAVDVPTIGIGAGRFTDGQVLVTNDVIGLEESDYRLKRTYANVESVAREAVTAFVEEVRAGKFPEREHAYEPVDEAPSDTSAVGSDDDSPGESAD